MEWDFRRIRRLRSLLGMTQREFAEAVGVNVITVSRWERDINRPASRAIARQLEALERSGLPGAGRRARPALSPARVWTGHAR